jgi:hypothetical protein
MGSLVGITELPSTAIGAAVGRRRVESDHNRGDLASLWWLSIWRAVVRRPGKTPTQELPMSTIVLPASRARLATAARLVLGLAFAVFGLNGFLDFLPHPTTPPPAGAAEFGYALIKTGYMFPLIKGTELAVGLLLLANVAVPLALVLIAPVLVNIIAFHVFLAPGELPIPLALVALELYLAWRHRRAFRALFARAA